jgi:ubiquinone/menaquinone biosynthesis C-methylase UbiE
MAPKPQESQQTLAKGMFRWTHEEQRAAVPSIFRNYWEKLAKKNGYYNREFMRKWGDGLENDFVLDAGCGQSSTIATHEPPLKKLIGLDPLREDMLIYEGAAGKVQGVLEQLPFADATFGGVYSDSVFEHIFNPGQVTREFYRITNRAGA